MFPLFSYLPRWTQSPYLRRSLVPCVLYPDEGWGRNAWAITHILTFLHGESHLNKGFLYLKKSALDFPFLMSLFSHQRAPSSHFLNLLSTLDFLFCLIHLFIYFCSWGPPKGYGHRHVYIEAPWSAKLYVNIAAILVKERSEWEKMPHSCTVCNVPKRCSPQTTSKENHRSQIRAKHYLW